MSEQMIGSTDQPDTMSRLFVDDLDKQALARTLATIDRLALNDNLTDPVFEEILMAEKPLAIVSYLVGESCVLSNLGCHFKAPGPTGIVALHADTRGPQPFATHAQTAGSAD